MNVSKRYMQFAIYTMECTEEEIHDIMDALKYADSALRCNNSVYNELLISLKYSNIEKRQNNGNDI